MKTILPKNRISKTSVAVYLLSTCLYLLTIQSTYAQTFEKLSFKTQAGAGFLFGDILQFNTTPMISLGANYRIHQQFSVEMNYVHSSFKGDEGEARYCRSYQSRQNMLLLKGKYAWQSVLQKISKSPLKWDILTGVTTGIIHSSSECETLDARSTNTSKTFNAGVNVEINYALTPNVLLVLEKELWLCSNDKIDGFNSLHNDRIGMVSFGVKFRPSF